MGRHLGIDFLTILVDLGTQVGTQNGPKIDPRRHEEQQQFRNAFWGRFGRGLGGATHPDAAGRGASTRGRGLSDPLKHNPEGKRAKTKGQVPIHSNSTRAKGKGQLDNEHTHTHTHTHHIAQSAVADMLE